MAFSAASPPGAASSSQATARLFIASAPASFQPVMVISCDSRSAKTEQPMA